MYVINLSFMYFQEVKNDLNLSPSSEWTYSHFKQQYVELDSWLNSVQKAIYAKEDCLIVANKRLVCGISIYLIDFLIFSSSIVNEKLR